MRRALQFSVRTALFLVAAGAIFGLPGQRASAVGFVELGGSVNYRYSGYDPNNYVQSLSYTATLSYYFWEMCALELNYTTGYSKEVSQGPFVIDPKETIEDNIQLTSLDAIFTLADKDDFFRPYVKIGGGYLIKQRFLRVDDGEEDLIASQKGVVPSGGFGFAVSLTKELNVKLGLDAWTSPLNVKPVIVDYAGRAGISWIF